MFWNAKKLIALDIGMSSIKMAELDVGRSSAKLTGFGIIPTTPGAFNNGEILDARALAGNISDLLTQFPLKRKKVSLGVSGTAVIVKKISVPKMDKKMLADQIRWEAEQYIPFDLANVALEHVVLKKPLSPDGMDILLVAAQNQVVQGFNEVVSMAGLEIKVIDVAGFSLANVFEFNYGQFPNETIALINIGGSTTCLTVVHSGEVIFVRDMNIGGHNYTLEIHKELRVSVPEAESLKIAAVRGDEVPDEVHSVMSSTNEMLKEEIRNSFEYFVGGASQLTIQRAFFTGGAAVTPGLIDGLQNSLQIPFQALNPFAKINPQVKGFTPDYITQITPLVANVLGYGLRKSGDA